MRKIFSVAIFTILIASCGNVNKIDFNEIDHIFIDYNPKEGNNYYSNIDARICVKTHLGKIIQIDSPKWIETSSNVNLYLNQDEIKVTTTPQRFNDSIVLVDLKLSNKDGEYVESKDTIFLNYRAPLNIPTFSAHGMDGEDGGNGGTALLLRNGKDGDHGGTGQNGVPGYNYLVHIWKKEGTYMIRMTNNTLSTTKYYQIQGLHRFDFSSNGGDGGDGGDGGNGGDGKDGKVTDNKTKVGGDGGDAGHGGDGGNGGNGGIITCLIHPNAQEFQSYVHLTSLPGAAGSAGKAGDIGKAGTQVAGQTPTTDGNPGQHGSAGQMGQNGAVSVLISTFDIN